MKKKNKKKMKEEEVFRLVFHLVALLKHWHGGVIVRAENVSQLLQTHLGEVLWVSDRHACRQKQSIQNLDLHKARNNIGFHLSRKCNSR